MKSMFPQVQYDNVATLSSINQSEEAKHSILGPSLYRLSSIYHHIFPQICIPHEPLHYNLLAVYHSSCQSFLQRSRHILFELQRLRQHSSVQAYADQLPEPNNLTSTICFATAPFPSAKHLQHPISRALVSEIGISHGLIVSWTNVGSSLICRMITCQNDQKDKLSGRASAVQFLYHIYQE